MRLYVVQQLHAVEWPDGAKPIVFYDRELAAKAWRDHVREDILRHLPEGQSPDEDDLALIDAIAVDWGNAPEDEEDDPEWIVGTDGPLEQMVMHKISSVEVPNLRKAWFKK